MLQPTTRKTMDSVDLWTDVADDLWQVRMPNGTLHAMSIEELDAAFTRGELDLATKVQHPSGGEWMTVGEAAGMAGDSITPMAVGLDVRSNIPRPPPLPRPLASLAADEPLSDEELRVVGLKSPRRTAQILSAFGGAALLLGGLVAWHFMPTNPIPSLTTTTITAPPDVAATLVQEPAPESTNPPEVAPETTPAPEGNAVAEKVAPKPVTPAKKPAQKKSGKKKKH